MQQISAAQWSEKLPVSAFGDSMRYPVSRRHVEAARFILYASVVLPFMALAEFWVKVCTSLMPRSHEEFIRHKHCYCYQRNVLVHWNTILHPKFDDKIYRRSIFVFFESDLVPCRSSKFFVLIFKRINCWKLYFFQHISALELPGRPPYTGASIYHTEPTAFQALWRNLTLVSWQGRGDDEERLTEQIVIVFCCFF